MSDLDDWLVDGTHVQLSNGNTVQVVALKRAIRAEIDARIAEHAQAYIHAEWGRAASPPTAE
jgi:hypothetical protein